MRKYLVKGYCKITGKKKQIETQASTSKHAKTIAHSHLTSPKVERKLSYRERGTK